MLKIKTPRNGTSLFAKPPSRGTFIGCSTRRFIFVLSALDSVKERQTTEALRKKREKERRRDSINKRNVCGKERGQTGKNGRRERGDSSGPTMGLHASRGALLCILRFASQRASQQFQFCLSGGSLFARARVVCGIGCGRERNFGPCLVP